MYGTVTEGMGARQGRMKGVEEWSVGESGAAAEGQIELKGMHTWRSIKKTLSRF